MIRWIAARLFGFSVTRDQARDWMAIFYIPVLSFGVCGMVWVLLSLRRPDLTVHYFGASLIGLVLLVGLGNFFLQRRTVNVEIETPAGSLRAENVPPDGLRAPLEAVEASAPAPEPEGEKTAS